MKESCAQAPGVARLWGLPIKIGDRGRNADVRAKAAKEAEFLIFGLEQRPLLTGFSKSQISRLCANLSSETDLQKLSLELRRFSSRSRLAISQCASLE